MLGTVKHQRHKRRRGWEKKVMDGTCPVSPWAANSKRNKTIKGGQVHSLPRCLAWQVRYPGKKIANAAGGRGCNNRVLRRNQGGTYFYPYITWAPQLMPWSLGVGPSTACDQGCTACHRRRGVTWWLPGIAAVPGPMGLGPAVCAGVALPLNLQVDTAI